MCSPGLIVDQEDLKEEHRGKVFSLLNSFLKLINAFIFSCPAFVAAHKLSLVAMNAGFSLVAVRGLLVVASPIAAHGA